MLNGIRTFLSNRKGLPPGSLEDWTALDLLLFGGLTVGRLARGIIWKYRFAESRGYILCDRRVRIYHAQHIRTGHSLNLEEGCEIVGLSQRGVVFGDRCTVGRFATIRPTNVLLGPPGEGLKMGDHSNVGPYSYIGCSGLVEIGSHVMMGPRVNLLAENHNFQRTDMPIKAQGVTRSPIKIEDDCWLGANCTIVAGVTIGRGAIVAAGAVVTHDVPPYSIVGGVPARVIRQRDPQALHLTQPPDQTQPNPAP